MTLSVPCFEAVCGSDGAGSTGLISRRKRPHQVESVGDAPWNIEAVVGVVALSRLPKIIGAATGRVMAKPLSMTHPSRSMVGVPGGLYRSHASGNSQFTSVTTFPEDRSLVAALASVLQGLSGPDDRFVQLSLKDISRG